MMLINGEACYIQSHIVVGWLVGFMACQPMLVYFIPKSV